MKDVIGKNYLRINIEVQTAMDDISPQVIKDLQEEGRQMFFKEDTFSDLT